MTGKKILIAADTYFPKVDGTLKFIEEFTKRAHNEFAISLLVPNFRGRKKQLEGVEGITYIEPATRLQISGYPSMRLSWRNFQRIKDAIRKADLIFVQGPALISYLSIYYGHRFKKKTVFYMHVITWELFAKFFPQYINRWFFRLVKKLSIKFYNWCDQIIAPYHELEEHLRKAGVKTSISVARLGVDIQRFVPSSDKKLSKNDIGIPPNKFVVGYVGRVSKEKNIGILLRAFQRLEPQENFHLLIVGDGPEEMVAECKALSNCTVTGFVDDVEKYLQAMDVFVMPSHTETTSLATLEAMACGLPVIVSKVGFMKNYIIKNHNGVFFARDSAAMLAIKITKFQRNYELRERLGKQARKTVAYSFSWERSINRIKQILLKDTKNN